ncbi:MAG: hypothetical protein HQL51_13970 [Magnetococcales bacterium]|nr:hypothetical protein [Magnetococcales bacterium]
MTTPTLDYTPYVLAVYTVALVVYGGALWSWRRQAAQLEQRLREHGATPWLERNPGEPS